MWETAIEGNGFAIIPDVVDLRDMARLIQELDHSPLSRGRAGIRHALKNPAVATLAKDPRLLEIAKAILSRQTFPFRATFFNKSPEANWLVAWHQDTALPLRERRDVPGWGPWSMKEGVHYAHAPASALTGILALRLHLDDSTAQNGPLRVLPGTHARGVLTDAEIHQLASEVSPVECLVPKGGVLAMRPLLVHASSKSNSDSPRRVLHIEYAASAVMEGLELSIV
jgi:ectoine hydroxylase-related dioxygenase (phytanoyl-CoA dioxygenase family)